MVSKFKGVIFLLYLFLGLYLINLSISLVILPEFFSSFDAWIFLIAGILMFVAGIPYIRGSKKE